jgi:hypothetical protein
MHPPHSSPSRGPTRIQNVIVWVTLFAVPLIWLLHLILCITLVAGACAGGVVQSHELRWSDAQHFIHAASAGAFVLCLALAIATGRAWRRTVWRADGRPDAACFVAWCSVLAAVVFTAALALTACVVIAAPLDRICAPFQ